MEGTISELINRCPGRCGQAFNRNINIHSIELHLGGLSQMPTRVPIPDGAYRVLLRDSRLVHNLSTVIKLLIGVVAETNSLKRKVMRAFCVFGLLLTLPAVG